jgi:hypothetical protein
MCRWVAPFRPWVAPLPLPFTIAHALSPRGTPSRCLSSLHYILFCASTIYHLLAARRHALPSLLRFPVAARLGGHTSGVASLFGHALSPADREAPGHNISVVVDFPCDVLDLAQERDVYAVWERQSAQLIPLGIDEELRWAVRGKRG